MNYVSRFLRRDINGTGDEETRNLRKDGSVYHAQTGYAVDVEVGIQDTILALLADLT